MARKPSPLDRLSANFLAALDQDFQEHGIKAIQELRQASPAKYSEIASRLIMTTEPAGDDVSKAQTQEEVARSLLKSLGCEKPTARQISQVVRANEAFAKKLDAIAGVIKWSEPTYNGRSVSANWDAVERSET